MCIEVWELLVHGLQFIFFSRRNPNEVAWQLCILTFSMNFVLYSYWAAHHSNMYRKSSSIVSLNFRPLCWNIDSPCKLLLILEGYLLKGIIYNLIDVPRLFNILLIAMGRINFLLFPLADWVFLRVSVKSCPYDQGPMYLAHCQSYTMHVGCLWWYIFIYPRRIIEHQRKEILLDPTYL